MKFDDHEHVGWLFALAMIAGTVLLLGGTALAGWALMLIVGSLGFVTVGFFKAWAVVAILKIVGSALGLAGRR